MNSILDKISADAAGLSKELGPADRSRLADYLTSLRELELRIQDQTERSSLESAILMTDIVALAFQTGTTRVATVMLGREKSRRTFPELNISETHHRLSHRVRDEITTRQLRAIDLRQIQLFARLVEKLGSMQTADGTVLDSTILLYGGGLSDGSKHRHDDLPILLAGGLHRPSDRARHIRLGRNESITALHESIAKCFREREAGKDRL